MPGGLVREVSQCQTQGIEWQTTDDSYKISRHDYPKCPNLEVCPVDFHIFAITMKVKSESHSVVSSSLRPHGL